MSERDPLFDVPPSSATLRQELNRQPEFIDSLNDDQIHDFGDLCWIEETIILPDPELSEKYMILPLILRLVALRSLQAKRDDTLLYGDSCVRSNP